MNRASYPAACSASDRSSLISQFHGWVVDIVARFDVALRGADVFVFASRTETQGLVLLEAMAAGLPVIALAEMGTIDILAPGRGAFCPPAEAQAFGEMLGHFLNRSDAWRHLAEEAPAYAREWSDAAMAARLAGLYRELAGLKIASERPLTATA